MSSLFFNNKKPLVVYTRPVCDGTYSYYHFLSIPQNISLEHLLFSREFIISFNSDTISGTWKRIDSDSMFCKIDVNFFISSSNKTITFNEIVTYPLITISIIYSLKTHIYFVSNEFIYHLGPV